MTSQALTDTEKRNAAVARKWFTEGWTTNPDMADQVFSPKFATNGAVVGVDGPLKTVKSRIAGFSDLRTEIEELVAVGDMIIIRVRWRGIHTGPYSGVPPTGKPVDVRVISMWRFEDGKAVDNWTIQDQFALLQQVGFVSATITTAQGTSPLAATAGVRKP
jgi:predicted ester cyclase